MRKRDKNFQEQVARNLEISKYRNACENSRGELLNWIVNQMYSAVMAHHADYIGGSLMGGHQPSSIRQALRGLLDAELARRSGRSQAWLTWAGFAISAAGFALAAVQLWITICGEAA